MTDATLETSTQDTKSRIQKIIAESSPSVVNAVVEHFANIEIDRRIKLIVDGMKKLEDAEKETTKIKPDHIIFDDEGKPITRGWTADQKNKKEKSAKHVDKLTTALNQAISGLDFKPLEEALKNQ
jgi:hypothetical protein